MEIKVSKSIFNEAYLSSLLDYSYRHEVYYGGAGSGKSHFVAQKLVWKAIQEPRKILALRKVGATVKDSVFQLLLDTLGYFQVLPQCKVNRTDYSILLPNGSIFLCKGLDNPEKVKSLVGLTDAWLEEATEFNQDDANQIDLRIRDPHARNQQLIFSFNPINKSNWCYKMFFKEDFETEEEAQEIMKYRSGVKVLHTNYTHNKFLPDAYISSLLSLKATNPTYYKIYAEGEFGSLGKTIYTNWEVKDFDYKELRGCKLVQGADCGFNDPNTLIASLVNEEKKEIYVFKEFYKSEQTLSEFAKAISEFSMGVRYPIYMDNSAKTIIESLRKDFKLNVEPCRKTGVIEGITRVQSYKIYVLPSCVNTIRELQNYSWKKDKKTNDYIDEPEQNGQDHVLDALVYSINSLSSSGSMTVGTKKILGL